MHIRKNGLVPAIAVASVLALAVSGCSSGGSTASSSAPAAAGSNAAGSVAGGSSSAAGSGTASAAGGSGAATASGSASSSEAASLVPSAVRAKGTIVNAMDASYPPYEYFGEDGHTIVGMDPDMLAAIGKELNLKITLVNASFATIIPGLTSGKYDIGMSSFIDTVARQNQLDFVTYTQGASAFYIKAGSSKTFNGLDSLCGAKVAVENGTTQQGQAQDQSKQCTAAGKPAVTVLSFDGQNDANLAVSSGRADLGFADGGLASYIVKQSHGEFAITGSPIEDVAQTGIAIPKGSGMAKATQAAINAMIKDGTYTQILKKWGTVGEAIPQSQINVAKS